MKAQPLTLSNGREIMRGGDWRRYVFFSRGRKVGDCIGSVSYPQRSAGFGFRFFLAGSWEVADAPPGIMPEIKPDVLNLIHGTPQVEADFAV
ncbi:MAG TPA: hypothetical protein VK742_08275 [Candidatus Sulfotelmatobacter sp.]|jgi:hypothetical protein|nr:hypothetical protein [Candidatus Sulfotelmatobacter sp.]